MLQAKPSFFSNCAFCKISITLCSFTGVQVDLPTGIENRKLKIMFKYHAVDSGLGVEIGGGAAT